VIYPSEEKQKGGSKVDWKQRLKKQTQEIGTYRPAFDVSIEILADILTQRDRAKEQWIAEGSLPTVELTNKATATHPALKLVMDCEAAALPYLKEMGLTASGYKRIKGDSNEPPKECVLDDLKSRFKVG
jgi:hypothetical protein